MCIGETYGRREVPFSRQGGPYSGSEGTESRSGMRKSGNDVRVQKIDKNSCSDAAAQTLAPPEPGRAPRPWPLPFISAAGSLLTASNRPVLHAAERIRGVRHQRPFVLERDGGDRRVMRADHLAQVPLPFR